MTWSLRVSNGDFVLDGGKLGTVTGANKLVQDFRHYLLQRMGTDPLYPSYGSLIDGGTQPNGVEVPSPLGGYDWNTIIVQIEAEIRRIALAYQRSQVERAKNDRLTYGTSTLSTGEILASVSSIDFQQNMDALNITITLETGNFQTETLNLALDPVITT